MEKSPRGTSLDVTRKAHAHSDVDTEADAQHHTIGIGENQAASGASVEKIKGRVEVLEADKWNIGDMKITAVDDAPDDWAFCDGAAISRATYAVLFAAVGTTYGLGDGATTFNLPDMRNRVPVGIGTDVALGDDDGIAEATRTRDHLHNNDHIHNIDHTHPIPHTHALSDSAYAQVTASATIIALRRIATGVANYAESFRVGGSDQAEVNPQNTATPLRGNTDASSAANSGAQSIANTSNQVSPDLSANTALASSPFLGVQYIIKVL